MESPADLQARWVHRREGETPGRALAAALHDVELPDGDGRIWVSCEASAMREIRRHFLDERRVDRKALRTQGYWKAGESNHPDHDMGEDA